MRKRALKFANRMALPRHVHNTWRVAPPRRPPFSPSIFIKSRGKRCCTRQKSPKNQTRDIPGVFSFIHLPPTLPARRALKLVDASFFITRYPVINSQNRRNSLSVFININFLTSKVAQTYNTQRLFFFYSAKIFLYRFRVHSKTSESKKKGN